MAEVRRTDIVLALAGPAAAGAAIGFPHGVGALLANAAQVPGIFLGVALLMLPALYIATAITGAAPPLAQLATAAIEALRDAGTGLLGLSPALLFLRATASIDATVGLAFLAVAIAALLCVRGLYVRLFHERSTQAARVVFTGWALVAGGVGLHLVLGAIR